MPSSAASSSSSLDVDARRRLQRRADLLVGALDLECARHHPAHALDLLPFLGQRLVAPRRGNRGECFQMHRAVLRGIARQPGFLRREAHERRQPRAGVAEDVLDRLQRRPALGAGIGLAVERILADVEIERRQVGVHELRQHRNHALVVVVGVGLAHDLVEFDEAMQHDLLQLRHGFGGMLLLAVVVGQRAQNPAQRVPELAIGLGGALQHRGPEADVAGVVGGRHPQAQDVGARGLHQVLRRERVALRLRHLLLALLVEDEAVGQHDVVGRAAARAAAFQQRGVEPAAVLVGAFQVHDGIGAAVALADDAGELGKVHRIFQREGVRGGGVRTRHRRCRRPSSIRRGCSRCRGSAPPRPAHARP